jgi:hypothetical protein
MSRSLDDLSSAFYPYAIEVLARLTERGIPVLIVDTLRTAEEHQANLLKGTSMTRLSRHLPRYMRMACTEADPDRNKSDAMDIAPYETYALYGPDKLQWDGGDPIWLAIGNVVETAGLVWGGRWKTPYDPGHLELRFPR